MKAKAAVVMQRKKAKYAALRPPPLSNELALMQFADGGSMDANIKRVMEAQAKASGGMGVGDVYRDGAGGVWWDQEEEYEYAHLLADGPEPGTGELQWITFNGDASMAIDAEARRGSMSTQDSDLDPRYIVQPSDADSDLVVPGSARRPGVSVLALPSRPRRTAKHLRKPDYLVDVAFPRSPLSPRGPSPTGKARRRPAPLKLMPPSPALKKPTNSPAEEFLASSFEPSVPLDSPLPLKKPAKKKPSMLNMMNLFRSSRKDC